MSQFFFSYVDTTIGRTQKRSAETKFSLPRYNVGPNSKTKANGASRARNASRKSLLSTPSKGSLNSILESDDESDVEVGRSCKIPDFYPPGHFTDISFDFVTSTPRVKQYVRPISVTTMSSESCYSLASAASLSTMITSDVFVTTVTAPSTNTVTVAAANIGIDRDIKSKVSNSGLAERRGFKGAPLFTAKAIKKASFPSFPAILSPRTPNSPPNSGIVTTMSNFLTLSPKVSVPLEAYYIPQYIQDDYNQNNPFDTTAESYFAPHIQDSSSSPSYIKDDLYDFSVYYAIAEHKSDFFKTNSLRKVQTGVPSRSLSKSKTHVRTNIYDMSIHDIYAQGSTREQPKSIAGPMSKSPRTGWFPDSAFVGSPNIWLTPPSAPSSPKKDDFRTQNAEAATIARIAVPPFSSATTASLPDARKSVAPRCPGLRPLILPLHIAEHTTSNPPLVLSPDFIPATKFLDVAPTSTPTSPQESVKLPVVESASFTHTPTITESSDFTPVQSISPPPSPASGCRSANSSLEKRRSMAMVDILSLLDAAALGAVEVLDVINCEDDSVDVGKVSLVGFVGTIAHAV